MMMSNIGVPFPRNYMATVKKIMTRLFRVFVHVYLHHFDKMVALGAVSFDSDNLSE